MLELDEATSVDLDSSAPPSRHRRGRLAARGSLALCAFGLLMWLWAVSIADPSHMGNFGLSTVLGWQYGVAVVAVASSITWELAQRRPRPLPCVLALLIVLFATAPAIEPIARFPTAWVHAGFITYIQSHGSILPSYDARFSWPGFFSLSAVLDVITGQHDPVVFLKWAPVVFELLYFAPLRVIAKATTSDVRAGWIGTVLFYAVNWIDQDYFSPQAFNMLLFLTILACVLSYWSPRRTEPRVGRWSLRGWRRGLGQVDGTLGASRQIGLELVLVVLCAACVASHQFTPYALVVALSACVACRRLPGLELPLLVGVMAVAWLSFATVSFWSGHLSLLFKGTGDLTASLHQNVGQRVVGAPAHRQVIELRLFVTMLLGALGVLAAWRRRGQGRALELLALTPFVLLAGGSYGGEALLRCFLFSLPFASLLAAHALVPLLASPERSPLRRRAGAAGLTVAFVVFALLLTVVRGGNDAFESFDNNARAAVLLVYASAVPGARLAATTPSTDQLPWRDEGLGTWRYTDSTTSSSAAMVARSLLHQRADWVVLTRNEERWGELVAGLKPGWQGHVEAELRAHGYRVFRRWTTALVLQREGAPVRHHAPRSA